MNLVKLEQISDMLRYQVESGAVKGGSAYVLKNGRPIFRMNVGMADEARGIKWENDTIVRLYSMTKPITAAAAMILLDRGKMDLFDKVSWYIPGFRDQKVLTENGTVPVSREVCVKDLLDMTSGLCYPDRSFPAGSVMQDLYDKICEEVAAGNPTDTIGYANRIGQQPLAFQPGDRWMYGTSADVLGAVVEVVSGKKFGEYSGCQGHYAGGDKAERQLTAGVVFLGLDGLFLLRGVAQRDFRAPGRFRRLRCAGRLSSAGGNISGSAGFSGFVGILLRE